MSSSPEVLDLLTCVSAASRHGSLERVRDHCSLLLGGSSFLGKRVLEIGCGGGQMALFLAASGAKHVVGLEPHLDGSNPRSLSCLRRIMEFGEVQNLEIIQKGFDAEVLEWERFDLILGINVINHLHETERRLAADWKVRASYLSAFRVMREALNPGGLAIFSDASRKNAWKSLRAVGLRHPFSPSISWLKHQEPVVWGDLFLEAGFSSYSVDWELPRRFGINGRVAAPWARSFLAWLWTSHFILRVRA